MFSVSVFRLPAAFFVSFRNSPFSSHRGLGLGIGALCVCVTRHASRLSVNTTLGFNCHVFVEVEVEVVAATLCSINRPKKNSLIGIVRLKIKFSFL